MKRILFMCMANACRSQMAEGFARALNLPDIEIYSAGSRPAMQVHPMSVAVMQEIGIDISRTRPKGVAELPSTVFDVAVSLCGDMCPTARARALAASQTRWRWLRWIENWQIRNSPLRQP